MFSLHNADACLLCPPGADGHPAHKGLWETGGLLWPQTAEDLTEWGTVVRLVGCGSPEVRWALRVICCFNAMDPTEDLRPEALGSLEAGLQAACLCTAGLWPEGSQRSWTFLLGTGWVLGRQVLKVSVQH